MYRNAENRFALNPVNLDISRSKFNRNHSVKTTFNVGDIVPFYVEEILPGDTFQVRSSKVIRMPSLLTPFMDNVHLDTYYFFVPNRLVWDHWRQFLGENDSTSWTPDVTYQIPTVTFDEDTPTRTGVISGSLADYMGIPTYVPGIEVNVLPFRAYALICNEWFRSEALSDPLVINKGDESVVVGGSDPDVSYDLTPYLEQVQYGMAVYKACKSFDYFTGALPSPQKGPDVVLPLAHAAPVVADNVLTDLLGHDYTSSDPLRFAFTNGNGQKRYDSGGVATASGSGSLERGETYISSSISPAGASTGSYPDNLVALLDQATGASVNELRIAFQLQKFYERAARGGTRYTEILRSFFGVNPPDASLQRPEYLGGNRIPIHVNQVIQQSSSTESSPQGNVAAMSLTTDSHHDFVKSFTEHGYIIGVMVARYDHTYQQGLERMWSRRDKFDFYFPVFANIGEQAVLNKEIYADGSEVDDEVFGYQEAWAEYRYKPNHVTGLMRSVLSVPGEFPLHGSLDSWHLADLYEERPTLSDSWIKEDSSVVDRVLAVSEESAGFQLFADIYVENTATRAMPLYSVPGLIDHH